VAVEPPQTYPKIRLDRIVGGVGYHHSNRFKTKLWARRPPGRRWNRPRWVAGTGSSTPILAAPFRAQQCLPIASSRTLASEHGPALLPYFKEFVMDYATFSVESITPRTKFVGVQLQRSKCGGARSLLQNAAWTSCRNGLDRPPRRRVRFRQTETIPLRTIRGGIG